MIKKPVYVDAACAADDALSALREARDCLRSARNWGLYDILGGGFLSSVIKHSRMSKANRCIEAARDSLRSLSHELAEIGFEIDRRTADFWGAMDCIFDSTFADVMMQSRIEDARRQVEQAIERVEFVRRELRKMNT